MCKMFHFPNWPNRNQIKLSCLFGLYWKLASIIEFLFHSKWKRYEFRLPNHFHKMLFAFDLLPPTDHFLIGSHFGDVRPHTLLIFTLHANISRNFVWKCKILNQRSSSLTVYVCVGTKKNPAGVLAATNLIRTKVIFDHLIRFRTTMVNCVYLQTDL